ncbi:porin family protein [Vibrio europaeus]|uniref:Porin family protein n=2 Tax=Vibrio europaeus TaxID=300876 RepID=A0ABT5GSE5_9VIBR|nr:porin family protein [Vibrio europaeus]MDC5709464.1 porin family protein [Vibrio europaeus]MDC5723529.1 porin family protein [Vibrio europaeus]MDC5730666.1 porin family protein [Vibrio europaeus]MDC5737136.1 porin family protein [Vibrio europaeus]MDC5740150.1 porin family protein [Vibrio europaeus]
MMKKVVLLAALVALPTFAAQKVDGFYIGAGIGDTSYADDGFGKSVTNGATSTETDGASFKLIGGYQFNKIAAIEAQYTKYGTANTKLSNTKALTMDSESLIVAANLGYTFDNGLRPYGVIGAGIVSWDVRNAGSTAYLNNKSSNTFAVRAGLGLEYAPAMFDGWAVRAGYEVDAFAADVEDSLTKKTTEHTLGMGSFYIGSTYKF